MDEFDKEKDVGNGFITLHRSIMDWEWYSDQNTFKLFVHCLLKANFKDKTWRGECIPRGSFVTSLERLASETGLSIHKVRIAFEHLESTKELSRITNNKYSIVTVNNYNLYQCDTVGVMQDGTQNGMQDGTQNGTQDGMQDGTQNVMQDGKQMATTNKEINIIVRHLNLHAKTNFKVSKTTCKNISARLNEGYSVAQCTAVIDVKCEEWLGTEMEKFLRPSTLFSPKNFENYLNQALKHGKDGTNEPKYFYLD